MIFPNCRLLLFQAIQNQQIVKRFWEMLRCTCFMLFGFQTDLKALWWNMTARFLNKSKAKSSFDPFFHLQCVTRRQNLPNRWLNCWKMKSRRFLKRHLNTYSADTYHSSVEKLLTERVVSRCKWFFHDQHTMSVGAIVYEDYLWKTKLFLRKQKKRVRKTFLR